MKDLERFETITGGPDKPGSIGKLHYRSKGRSYVMEDRMLEVDPGKRYLSRVTGDVIEAEVETLFDKHGTQTGIKMKWSGRGKKILLRIILPLLRQKITRDAKAELELFKKLVEERGTDFNQIS